MANKHVYLTRRIRTKGDAAEEVMAIVVKDQSEASHEEAATIAGKYQHEILGCLFDGQSLFEVIWEVEPTVEEAKKAYLDSVSRYRAEVDPTKEELDRAEEYLSDFDNEETYRGRNQPGQLEGLDADERVLDQIMEQRGDEEESEAAGA
jgi:hypothetical protein